METDWLHFEVNRPDWLPGRAMLPEGGWPPSPNSVFGAGIGLGTAGLQPPHGNAGSEAEQLIRTAVRSGIRIIDTATIYGYGLAEVAIGAAIRAAATAGEVGRSDVAVISKAGYERGPEWFSHSIEPAFLSSEIAASRRRMGLQTIDIYLLHNLEEQLVEGGAGWAAVGGAFRTLEAEAAEGYIGCYGVAAAEGFLPSHRSFHSLQQLLRYARAAGGAYHHFRVIELPISLWRREAFSTTPYTLGGRPASVLDLAAEAGLIVLASIPMGHGRGGHPAVELLRERFPKDRIGSSEMMALQFARSIPGVYAALPGISTLPHLKDAIDLMRIRRWQLEVCVPTETKPKATQAS